MYLNDFFTVLDCFSYFFGHFFVEGATAESPKNPQEPTVFVSRVLSTGHRRLEDRNHAEARSTDQVA